MSLAPIRQSGPLGELQSDADALKIKIDELTGITSKWNYKSADEPQVKSCHKDCISYKIEASSLLLRANNLQQYEEPQPSSNFDQKKLDEIKRLQALQERINRMMHAMEELEDGQELRNTREKSLNEANEKHDDESEEEDDNEDEEEDVDDEDEEEEDLYIAIHEFKGVQDGDLSIEMDEIVDVIHKREDGWWEAENEDGKRGLVPSNFLEKYSDDEEEPEHDHPLPSQEEVDAPSHTQDKEENTTQDKEQIASKDKEVTFAPSRKSSSGKLLWKQIKDAVNEPKKMDVTDVLAAMGALPAGFRPSTLHSLLSKGDEYTLRSAILPTLAESNLSYKDLNWDTATNQLGKVITRSLRSCKIWKCTMVPLPGTGVEVLSRHVRLALFDGNKVISNIATIRANVLPTKPKLWQFSSASSKEGGLLPSLLDGHMLVKSDSVHSNLGILFELCLTYIRSPPKRLVQFSDGVVCEYSDDDEDPEREKLRQTGERGELSCGWAHLKLFDERGMPIQNSTFNLPLNGGTPYEVGVDVDPSILRRASTNRFRNLLAANKQPKIIIQMGSLSVEKKKYIDLLPATVVLPVSYCELVSVYRRLLVDALVRDRSSLCDASLVHSPVIVAFLAAVDQPDLMDALRRIWLEKTRSLTRADKRDKEYVKDVFKSVVMETIYPLLHLRTLPQPRWADHQVELARSQHINQTLLSTKQQIGVLNHFLSSSVEVEPFDISEVAFDPIRNYGRVL